MGFRRSSRPSPQRPRSRAGESAGTGWWRGWGLKTAVISAVVPLIVGAAWAQGMVLMRAWVGAAPSASASPPPAAFTAAPASGPSTSLSPSNPEPTPIRDPTGDPAAPPPDGAVPKPSRTAKPAPPPQPPSGQVTVAAQVRRSGTLVMADYTAYDLDSMVADWDPTKDDWGPHRDVGYASWWPDANNDAVVSRDDPRYAASLPGTGPWQRGDCVRARYGEPSARPIGERLLERRGICVVTSAGRYALLVVTRATQGQLTVRVTVWD